MGGLSPGGIGPSWWWNLVTCRPVYTCMDTASNDHTQQGTKATGPAPPSRGRAAEQLDEQHSYSGKGQSAAPSGHGQGSYGPSMGRLRAQATVVGLQGHGSTGGYGTFLVISWAAVLFPRLRPAAHPSSTTGSYGSFSRSL